MTNSDCPFFLTKHSANLSQQLRYSLAQETSRCLILHGDEGVGKTFLSQFIFKSFDAKQVVNYLDITSDQALEGYQKQYAGYEQSAYWVIDSVDTCSLDGLQALVAFLTQLKGTLVFVCKTALINELQVFLRNQQMNALLFGVAQLSFKESIAYIEQRIKRATGLAYVVLSLGMKWRIFRAKGNFERLNRLYILNEAKLNQSAKESLPAQISLADVAKILLLILLLSLLWLAPVNSTKIQALLGFFQLNDSAPQLNTLENKVQLQVELEPEPEPLIATNEEPVTAPVTQQPEKKDLMVDGQATEPVQEQTVSELDNKALAVELIHNDGALAEQDNDVLLQKLAVTQHWLDYADDNEWTNQILIFAVKHNSNEQFNDYLKQLNNRQISIEPLMVYEFKTSKFHAYSILYGRYENKEQARLESKKLPDFLRRDAPILRSVKGLRAEIKNNKK